MNPIHIPVAELKPALAGLGKVISKRITLPVLSHICIERTDSGAIELTGTDLDATAIVRLPTADPGVPGKFLVPYEDFNNTIKSCGRDDVLVVAPLPKSQVAFRFPVGGQTIKHRCESLPVDEFPPVAKISGEPVKLDGSFRRAIHEALACASTDPTRVVINGAYLDVSKPGAHYVVGTDGHHLFSSNSFALELEHSLIIPSHRFLGWKEFNGDGDWTLRVSKKECALHFELASKHWRFITKAHDGNYPNWRQVVPGPDQFKTTVEVDPVAVEAMTQIIARLPNPDAINHGI